MNIVIVGGGAIGVLFYQALSKHPSIELALLTKAQHCAAEFTTSFTNLAGYSTELLLKQANTTSLENADIVLICVKSYQITSAFSAIQPHLNDKTTVIFCHNGIADISALKVQQTSLLMLTTHGCKKAATKHFIHTGKGQHTLGLLSGSKIPSHTEDFIALVNQVVPKLIWQDNIIKQQWQKLAINCVINPLTALYDVPNGELSKAKYQLQIVDIIKEFIAVAKSQQVIFNLNLLHQQILSVAKATALNSSSMRSDVAKGIKTEIDFINGYIVTLGKKNNITTPVNRLLCQQVQRLVRDK
ncbi:MAG: ketopantoate reductase family protein [Thalassotalea sp.]